MSYAMSYSITRLWYKLKNKVYIFQHFYMEWYLKHDLFPIFKKWKLYTRIYYKKKEKGKWVMASTQFRFESAFNHVLEKYKIYKLNIEMVS